MANTDSPFGFRPYQSVLSVHEYVTTNNSCIGQGHIIVMRSTGRVRGLGTSNGTVNASKLIVGVAAHFVSSTASNVSRTVLVYDDPSQEFVAQVDDDSVDSRTDLYAYYAVTYGGGALDGKNSNTNRTTLQSKIEIDGSRKYTTVTRGGFQVRDWYKETGWTTNASWVKVICKISPMWHVYGATLAKNAI